MLKSLNALREKPTSESNGRPKLLITGKGSAARAKQNERAEALRSQVQKALKKFKERLANKKAIAPSSDIDLKSGPNHRRFCYGAILCQNGKAKAASLSLAIDEEPENPRWGFICQHCNLEVGDYKALRMKADGTVLEISDLLAASHLMACDLKDMRAFYRCLACHLDQRKVDFATATELEKHMDEHADFSFLPEQLQSAGEKAAEKDVEEFMNHDITTPPESTTVTQVPEDPEPQSDPESLETLKASDEFTPSWQELSASHEKATPIQPAPHWPPPAPPKIDQARQDTRPFGDIYGQIIGVPPSAEEFLTPSFHYPDNSRVSRHSSPGVKSFDRRPVGDSSPRGNWPMGN